MRINKNVLIGLAVAAVLVLAVAPRALGRVLPLLLFASCPLSMVFMMRAMGGNRAREAPGNGRPADREPADPQMEDLRAEVARLRDEVAARDMPGASDLDAAGGASRAG